MDAIIPAAGVPKPGEPLYEHIRGKPKALLAAAGKPMVQRVLDAMSGASLVDRVILIGLEDGGKVRFVICPYAEVTMDVDQPHHLEIVSDDLSSQVALV